MQQTDRPRPVTDLKRPFDVLVVGELNPDLILSGDVTPIFGQVEKLVDGMELTIGSSAAIFACGCARLGLKVAFTGKIGKDEFGEFMLNSLKEHGVDTHAVIVDPLLHTGLTLILARGSDRAILTYPGAIPSLRFSEIDPALIAGSRHLHLASYFIQDALQPDVPKLFELAHKNGLTVSLDTNYDPAELWDGGLANALAGCDIFLPNASECQAIAGTPDLEKALEVCASKVGIVAVKQGAEGAILQQGKMVYRAPSLTVNVVDTVGAGDSFDAGFIYGYLNGWNPARCLRMGTVCGALSTRAMGGTSAQPTMEETITWV
jgi:sugar/nucleoside kinase (ribokinase family)